LTALHKTKLSAPVSWKHHTVARLGVLLRKHDKRESMRLLNTLTLIVSLELSVRITLILSERKFTKEAMVLKFKYPFSLVCLLSSLPVLFRAQEKDPFPIPELRHPSSLFQVELLCR